MSFRSVMSIVLTLSQLGTQITKAMSAAPAKLPKSGPAFSQLAMSERTPYV